MPFRSGGASLPPVRLCRLDDMNASPRVIAHNAHIWGVKAAREGLPRTSNPYINLQARAAWQAGWNEFAVIEVSARTGTKAIASVGGDVSPSDR